MRKIGYDIIAAIPAAWDFLWKDNLKEQKKAKSKPGYRDDRAFFLTASDLEAQVRQFALDVANGKAPGSSGRAFGYGFSYTNDGRKLIIRGNLQSLVRDWLFNEVRCGRIQSHNFNRGHISGARFRPKGAPLTAQEQKTFERKAKDAEKIKLGLPTKPRHYAERYGARILCMKEQMKGRISWRGSRSRYTRSSDEISEVTCPRCLKLLREMKCEEVANV